MKNNIIHKASTRGYADHGWLVTHHTFSFANYYNAERVHFGMLRVLNDDWIEGGMGFGTHPHDNMEIITIPLSGAVSHRDSMGNHSIIQEGEIQVMSAGSGITHSEFNANKGVPVTLLQIWVFPNQKDVDPRYDQIKLNLSDRKNQLQQIVSPNPKDTGVWIHQNAWFHLTNLDKGKEIEYSLKHPGHGVYVFIIKGNVKINDQTLHERDGMGITDLEQVNLIANSDSEVLLMEIPMK
jgi:quercetin 2,3-dioxygenase